MAQQINVDIKPGLFQPTLHFSQGDIGREFAIKIVTSDGFSVPVGATVDLVGTKPSGFGFTVPCTVSGNTVSFTSSNTDGEVFTDEHGIFPAELVIKNNGDVIGTANFFFSGEKNPHPAETIDGEAEQIIPELTLLVERVEAAASSVLDMQVVADTLPAGSDATYSYDEETNTATFGIPKGADGSLAPGVLAPTYSSSATYAVGDYVYYSGDLYRCVTAITTAEAWTSGHWTQLSLANDVADVTGITTESGYDENDNLCDGKTLTLGYYANGGTFNGNSNFSYLKIDVAGIEKLKIDGTHHIYTSTQFNAMGVFVTSGGTYVDSILNVYGSNPSFPYEIEVPQNADELWLNTDYKASDYPSSLPDGLYVYPWKTTYTSYVKQSAINPPAVSLSDLSSSGKKIKILAGVVRNSGTGWEYINDSGHEPLNLTAVSVDSNGRLKIEYGFTASKVLSLVAAPDEKFARQYTIGGSVGLDNTLFNIYTLPQTYGGMVGISNNSVTVTNSSFTSGSFNQTTGEIKLYHPTLSTLNGKEKFNISAICNNATYEPVIGSQGNDYVSLYLKNSSNGTILKDTTGLSINLVSNRIVNANFIDASNIVSADGNFWIYGVMEI